MKIDKQELDDYITQEPDCTGDDFVPMRLWGRDHWTTILYVETCAVDNYGKIDNRRMRTDNDLHPVLSHHKSNAKCPTRLSGNTGVDPQLLEDHDDWSCLDDAQEEGLLTWKEDGHNATVKFTNVGWFIAGKLRRFRAEIVPEEAYYSKLTEAIDEEFIPWSLDNE